MSAPAIQFLMHSRKPSRKLHFWTGADSACRMFSTGGMKREDWTLTPIINPETEQLCHLCEGQFNIAVMKEGRTRL